MEKLPELESNYSEAKEEEEEVSEEELLTYSEYKGREDKIICGRFPNMKFCGCTIPCRIALKEVKFVQVNLLLYIVNRFLIGFTLGPFNLLIR